MLLAWSSPISFEQPQWLYLLMVIPIIVVVSLRSLTALEGPRRIAVIVLRCLVVAVLAIALAGVQYVKRNENVAVMFVLDRSRSIPEELQDSARDYIRQLARRADRDDRVGVVSFDGEADINLIPSRGGMDVRGDDGLISFGMAVRPDRTDISAGLRLAMAALPEGFARRIVLLSDGNENSGDVQSEIEAARAAGIPVDVVPLQYHHADEILFDRMVVPANASRESRVPVRMVIKSRRPARARLTLYHNGREVPLSEEDRILELSGGMRPEPFTVMHYVDTGGVHRFEADLTPIPAEADSITENNRATAFTFVEDEGRVLILTNPGSTDDRVLYDALRREQVDVEIRGVDEVTVDLLHLQEYGVVLLSNISADEFNEQQHRALASYVRDFGGGLIMTGGNEGFGAGGWIGTPVEEVSPVAFEVKHKEVIPRGALVIIMHSCEIPRGNYWGEQVAIASVNAISSLDYLGIISYNWSRGGANWDVPLAPATNKPAIIRTIRNIENGDMPDFGTSMNMAVNGLLALPDVAQRHMIIISDGDPSPPSQALIQRMVDNQITCSTVGIGYGSHVFEAPLRRIASLTGGRFYPVRNPRTLPQIFVKETKVIKRSLIDDRPFAPRVTLPFAPTLTGIATADAPGLGGLVLTTPKPDAIIPIVRTTSDGDDPVLAHWNYEMGKMVAFTSGWWPNWGADWSGWEMFGKFWAQVVRWAMRPGEEANFDIITRLEGNEGRIVVEALNKDAGFLNFLDIRGRLLTPDMEQVGLLMTQTGPGQYEATFDVHDDGNYLVNLRYVGPDGEEGMIRTGLSVPYSPEFRELNTNFTLLEQIADRTGGRMLEMTPDVATVFSRDLPPSVSRQPVWRWVVQWLLLPLFLLDVASRRLASTLAMSLYVEAAVLVVGCAVMHTAGAGLLGYVGVLVLAELIGWTIRYQYIVPAVRYFTSTVAALSRAGHRSAESLSQLKDVRDRVREGLQEREDDEQKKRRDQGAIPLDPIADRSARFDVGDEAAKEEAGDLTAALGGATVTDETLGGKARRGRDKDQAEQDKAEITSRLLKAKRRAQDGMKDRQTEN